MIIIYPEKLSTISADTADAEFPVTNLEDNKIKKVWKSSGSHTGVLTANVAAGANQCAVFGTNSVSATVVVKIGAVTQETQVFSLSNGNHTYNQFWCSYTAIAETHTVEITLTTTVGTVVEAGAVKIGVGVKFINPKYGIGETRKDFSIVKELNNGALYVRKRNIVREFSVNFLEDRATDYYLFTDIYDYYGPQAVAILLAEDVSDYEWAILGHIRSPFSGSHQYFNHTDISFSIMEAV